MRKAVRYFLHFALLLAGTHGLDAATDLKTDPSVSSGSLGCGLSYYLVTNASKAGMADFALVRKLHPAGDRAAEEEFSRSCLDSLPHFGRRTPVGFLSDNGVSYPAGGYLSVEKDAAIYHFRDVFLDRNAGMTDSTLLMLFDIVLKTVSSPAPDTLARSVGDQAVIISGDIDKDLLLRKMNMLSLMVSDPGASPCTEKDSTSASGMSRPDTLILRTAADTAAGTARVSAIFYGPEIPRRLRGTAISLLSAQFWSEFRIAAQCRISDMLRNEGIPCASVNLFRYSTAEAAEQEKYMASVGVSPKDTSRVKEILAGVLASFRENGLGPEEYRYSRKVASVELYSRSAARSKENSSYVRKCADAFVYGSAIVSAADEAEFFLTSGLPDTAGRRYLNSYIASLIPASGNDSDFAYAPAFSMSDTLRLAEPGPFRAKVKKSRHTKVSDADIWMFSNGMSAIYKKMPTAGIMHYSWVFRSGYGSVPDLEAGEGAFYSDMLLKGTVCGLDGPALERILAAEGISMSADVGLSSTRIYGSAPFDRMTLLMKTLLSFSRSYSENGTLGQYYMECERLRLSSARGEYQSRLAVIDSIMNSGSVYSGCKSLSGLHDGLPDRAGKFYRELFSRFNDGVLVLVGDMDAYDVRKILEEYFGGFVPGELTGRRPWISSQPISGWSTYVSDGRSNSMDVVLSARFPLTSANYMSARIATMAIKDAISHALADYGMAVRVSGDFSFFPYEGYSVSVSVVPARLSSLPPSVAHASYFTCLYSARSAISALQNKGLDGDSVETYRKILLDSYRSGQSDPEFWIEAISGRVATGKSLDMEYERKISEVTAESVNRVLSELGGGSIVEYIIKKD